MKEIYFDLETTGTNPVKDRIVELSAIIFIDNEEVKRLNLLINPEVDIPAQASQVHRITNEMVKDKKTFADIADKLYKLFEDAILIGYNSINFDTPLLINEFKRCGINFKPKDEIDVYQIWVNKEKTKKLNDAYKRFCLKDMDPEQSHRALYDVECTRQVFGSQKIVYNLWDNNELIKLSKPSTNKIKDGKFNFGKYKGKTIKEIKQEDRQYINWLLLSDIEDEVKTLLK
jgi:DNA polymerase-3 subunit epsilon